MHKIIVNGREKLWGPDTINSGSVFGLAFGYWPGEQAKAFGIFYRHPPNKEIEGSITEHDPPIPIKDGMIFTIVPTGAAA